MKCFRLLLVALAAWAWVSCHKLEVTVENLYGDWVESYDSETSAMDGTVVYSLFPDGCHVQVFSYDALDGTEETRDITYLLEGDLLTLNPQLSDPTLNVSY